MFRTLSGSGTIQQKSFRYAEVSSSKHVQASACAPEYLLGLTQPHASSIRAAYYNLGAYESYFSYFSLIHVI